ncbi:MAG: aldo/keto reductase [Acidobacteriaceae bacterium]
MLERIRLPGSDRATTRLGFGGSGLMGGLSERASLKLLETAFDAGIRHFDVAPAYGHGQAERCLGKFLRGKREQVTVATKYGILPPPGAGLLGVVRSVVRPVVRRLPAVRTRVAAAAAGLKQRARFSAEEAERLLERSRRELGIDRIDVWLLHEATAGDLDGSDLPPFLQAMRQQGRIGMFGVGTGRAQLNELWQRHRDCCKVLQFEWPVLEEKADFPGAFVIYHRAISGAGSTMCDLFEQDAELCRRWSNAVDADLSDTQILGGVLLQAALAANPDGMVLFFSRVHEHIRANAHAAEDATSTTRGKRFLELIAEMRNQMDDRQEKGRST